MIDANSRKDCDTCRHNVAPFDVDTGPCIGCPAPAFPHWEAGPESPYPYEPCALSPGDRLWNGRIVSPQLAAAYNSANARIAAFEASGRPAPEHLLNGRHNLIAGPPA